MHVASVQTSAERGGGEYANVDLLDGLARAGDRVRLITNLVDIADGTAVLVTPIDLGPKLGRKTAGRVALRFPAYVRRLRGVLSATAREHAIDTVLLHYKKEQLMSAFLPRGAFTRLVWAEWGPLPREFRRGPARLAYVRSARRAAHIVAISEGAKRSLTDAGVPAAKISVIPNIVDIEAVRFDAGARTRLRAEWGMDDDTFVIGSIARFHRKKRNDVVIDMLDHIVPNGRPVALVLAGEGDDEPALRRRAAHRGPQVRFLTTPRGYVEDVLSACDVQVYAPSPTEGAPRSVVLGQLVGRPVIATDGEGVADMLPAGTGTIVSPSHDPAALAGVVAAYRDDPQLCAREGAAARAFAAERYDGARALEAFRAVLKGDPT
jgi:glycosyltransferase involved in cell wall biosynthesis